MSRTKKGMNEYTIRDVVDMFKADPSPKTGKEIAGSIKRKYKPDSKGVSKTLNHHKDFRLVSNKYPLRFVYVGV